MGVFDVTVLYIYERAYFYECGLINTKYFIIMLACLVRFTWNLWFAFYVINESMVSLVSRRYMRGVNGTESLLVCLSEYVTLHSVYTLLIAVY